MPAARAQHVVPACGQKITDGPQNVRIVIHEQDLRFLGTHRLSCHLPYGINLAPPIQGPLPIRYG
jgi:hypothetical protein